MKKSAIFLFFFVLVSQVAQGAVISAYYDDLRASLYVFSSFTDKTALNEISLRDCKNEQTFYFDKNARNFLVSSFIPSFVIYSSNAELKIFDVFSGKTETIKTGFTKGIRIISQWESGEFFAVSDGLTVILFTFEKDKVKELFRKEMIADVIALLPDGENKTLYVAERNGALSAWSFDGRLINSSDIKATPSELIFDNVLGRILVVTKNGIFALNKTNFTLTKVLENSSTGEVFLDNYARRLTVSVPSGAAIYEYPSLRLITMIPGGGGRIVNTGRAAFSAFAKGSSVDIFDIKLSQNIARISINEKGVFFDPPNNDKLLTPFGVTSSFINDAAGNKNKGGILAQGTQNVCATLSAAVSGVYSPNDGKIPYLSSPNNPKIAGATIPKSKSPATVETAKAPTVDFKSGAVSPKIDDKFPQPAQPLNPDNPALIPITNEPKEPTSPVLEMTQASGVPSWIAGRKNLTYNKTVASGQTLAQALANAEKNLKNNIVRALIDNFLKNPKTASIKNAEATKRFLWQSASSAALELTKYIKTENRWTSPAGMNYILAGIDEKTVKKISDELYEKEMANLSALTAEEYLKIKPNKID